ncbi:MAG TPA: hypothetical protein VIM89_05010 [Mucilaginibacter sp.]
MAGIKLHLRSKVAGSTIAEVMVAMVILVTIFGIAMMIYARVTGLSPSAQNIQARAILKEHLLMAEHISYSTDSLIDTAGLHIEIATKPYDRDTSLQVIRLTAYDQNRQIVAELQKLELK